MVDPVFVMCRSVADGVTPGSQVGYSCKLCGKPIAVTPYGLLQRSAAGPENTVLLCNPCGNQLVEAWKEQAKAGSQTELVMQVNPDAVDQIERVTGKCVLDVFPQATVTFDPLDAMRDPKRRT